MEESLKRLLKNSYSPYSGFRVAAICLMKDGKSFGGVNFENASYGVILKEISVDYMLCVIVRKFLVAVLYVDK